MAWQELQAWTALARLMAAHAGKANEVHWLSESGRALESDARRPVPSVSGEGVPASHHNRTSIYHISLSANGPRTTVGSLSRSQPLTRAAAGGLAGVLAQVYPSFLSQALIRLGGFGAWHGRCSQESRRALMAREAKIPRPTFVRERF